MFHKGLTSGRFYPCLRLTMPMAVWAGTKPIKNDWLVFPDEKMSKGCLFSLRNGKHLSNWVVEHWAPVISTKCRVTCQSYRSYGEGFSDSDLPKPMTLGRQKNGSTATACFDVSCAGNKNQFRALVEEINRLGGQLFFQVRKTNVNVFTDGGFKDRCFVRICCYPETWRGEW